MNVLTAESNGPLAGRDGGDIASPYVDYKI